MAEILKKLEGLDRLEKSLKIVETSIKNVESKIETIEKKFEEKLKNMKADIDKKLVEVIAKEKQNNAHIQNVYAELKGDIESIKKSTEILVAGLPESLNMTLPELYKKIASAIGYGDGSNTDVPVSPNARYVLIKNTKTKTSTVLIRFANIFDKNDFLANYYKDAKNFNMRKLGYTGDQRLYMSHNLPQHKYQIFKKALERKKKKVFDSVRVSDFGDIRVRVAGESKLYLVKSIEDVNKFPEPNNSDDGESSSGGT